MAAASVRNFASGQNLGAPTLVVQPGGDISVGDWMIVVLAWNSQGGTHTAPSSQFVQLGTTVTTGTLVSSVWVGVRGSGDTSYTFNSSVTGYGKWSIIYGTGGKPTANWLSANSPRASNATSTTTVAPALSAQADNCLVVAISTERTSAAETDITSVSAPATKLFFSAAASGSQIETIAVATKTVTAGNAITATTFTYPNVQATNGWAMTVAIPEAAAADLRGTGLVQPNLKRGNGSAVKVWYTNSSGAVRTPNFLQQIPLGFRSVDEVLAKQGFTMGHRGNSTRYAEMSLYAYTQTAARGYGIMEVSVGRTSDGVFVGLHDDDINRTSKTSGLPALFSMTWAQVQTYNNLLGTQNVARPYMSLDQYIAAYGATHVTMFDPKTMSTANRLAMYSKLQSEVGIARTIIKAFGASPGMAVQAQSYGFKTWGYFYAAGIDDGSFALHQAPWDILGMEYNVAQSYWDTTLAAAGSRKVIAHIVPNQAGYDTAMAKGAHGAQVSASHLVKGVSR